MISLDTETTGSDFWHGARPYFVTICDDEGTVRWWEWPVDPTTRQPAVPPEDLEEIASIVRDAPSMVGQSIKFDVHALSSACPDFAWPWDATHDTIVAGHLLGSNLPHNLTDMVLQYLGEDIKPYEDALEEATVKARAIARRDLPEWMIAREGLPNMPSVKGSSGVGKKEKDRVWKNDAWLPLALCDATGAAPDHPWRTVLRDYANTDSVYTLLLWRVMEAELKRRKLWNLYQAKMRTLPYVFDIERRGMTMIRSNLDEMKLEYAAEIEERGKECEDVAWGFGFELALPKGASPNGSLREFCLDVLKLEPVYNPKAKTGEPTLGKDAMQHWLDTLEPGPKLDFVKALDAKRTRDTQLGYLNAYDRFALPMEGEGLEDFLVVRPHHNPVGTDATRGSSSDPNGQNASKKEAICRECFGEGCDACNGTGLSMKSLRRIFGPAPGREWWSLDGENLEVRIPAYEIGEEMLVELFEEPDRPPFFGSVHMLNFSIVYPDVWEPELREHGESNAAKVVKHKYAGSWYRRCKGGWFAIQYGALLKRAGWGTADRAFGRQGAHATLMDRFEKTSGLNQSLIAFANRMGYVETIPLKGEDRGYPLLVTRTEHGRVLETVPMSYHVQGSAGEWKWRAVVRCGECLADWRRRGFDAFISNDVHDELVFDMPRRANPKTNPKQSNLWRARELRRLMELGGEDVGVKTRVSMEWHEIDWSKGVAL